MRAAAALLAAALLAPALPAAGHEARTVALTISPLDLVGGEYRGARLTGAWRLKSPEPAFGGISGVLVEGGDVLAVTDRGWWIEAARHGETLASEIAMRPMRRADGGTFDKSGGDAESLARRGDEVFVGFERDHRVARRVGTDTIGGAIRAPAMERMPSNGGLEALATLPDGRLIAIGEGREGEDFPVFVIDAADGVTESRLPRQSRHDMTGADMGPDGWLYVVQRHFSMLTGVSIRVRRYLLGDDGLPDPGTAETLAAWETMSGIDNMEAIAAFRDGPQAPVTLWLLSDDNFNAIQRTILVTLEVE
ncbi:MAG TPA: esterase-like activity of phytase family protein [Thermohalobaculum sp.]|nr:esterase-like activity of phytase family protein [Thermohalobaculum sp.]